MSQIKVALIGAGDRGSRYARYAELYPERMQLVAVAEPNLERRTNFAQRYQLVAQNCFSDWQALLAAPLELDAVFVCTTDMLHTAPASAALAKGYHVLLEKPMAPTLDEAVQLVQLAETSQRILQICHVLRYTNFFQKVREVVQSGRLGRLINITHTENLVYWHMAHSFVRGNWRNTEVAAPMILAKCCHDFDILQWIIQKPVTWLSSLGDLSHFRPENAPAGAPLRCTDGCSVSETCKFYSPRLYHNAQTGWPYDVVTPIASLEARLAALQSGPYGRCVYHCDNNVVDHQVVNMAYADGLTATLVMNGHGSEECRTMRYDGTLATLRGKFSANVSELTIHDHLSGEVQSISVEVSLSDAALAKAWRDGHGGGDLGIVHSFIEALNGETDAHLTTARVSLESHLLAFAAEQSRLTHQVVAIDSLRATF
jgi:predicted dehydrogenase